MDENSNPVFSKLVIKQDAISYASEIV